MEVTSEARKWRTDVTLWLTEITYLTTDIYNHAASIQSPNLGEDLPFGFMMRVEKLYDAGFELLDRHEDHAPFLKEQFLANPESRTISDLLDTDNAAMHALLRGLDLMKAFEAGVSGTELELRIQIFRLQVSVFDLWRRN